MVMEKIQADSPASPSARRVGIEIQTDVMESAHTEIALREEGGD